MQGKLITHNYMEEITVRFDFNNIETSDVDWCRFSGEKAAAMFPLISCFVCQGGKK